MSKKQKSVATAVALPVSTTEAEALDTPLNPDVPEEVVQTNLDSRIESAVETITKDKPKFVERIHFGANFAQPFSNVTMKGITIAGQKWGTVKFFTDNYFSPAFIKKGFGTEAIEYKFESDKDIKSTQGLTGTQKAMAWLNNESVKAMKVLEATV